MLKALVAQFNCARRTGRCLEDGCLRGQTKFWNDGAAVEVGGVTCPAPSLRLVVLAPTRFVYSRHTTTVKHDIHPTAMAGRSHAPRFGLVLRRNASATPFYPRPGHV